MFSSKSKDTDATVSATQPIKRAARSAAPSIISSDRSIAERAVCSSRMICSAVGMGPSPCPQHVTRGARPR